MEAKLIEGFPILFKIEQALRYAGYPIKVQRERPNRVRRAKNKIIELWEQNKCFIHPQAIYEFFDYQIINQDQVVLNQAATFTSFYLVKNLQKSDSSQVLLYVVTIGKEIIERIEQYPPDSENFFYLEAIGSEAVEAAGRTLRTILPQQKGFSAPFNKPLSPGWGEQKGFDWKLKEQRILFELLGRDRIKNELGVVLIENPEVESYMMLPRKTVSAIAFSASEEISEE